MADQDGAICGVELRGAIIAPEGRYEGKNVPYSRGCAKRLKRHDKVIWDFTVESAIASAMFCAHGEAVITHITIGGIPVCGTEGGRDQLMVFEYGGVIYSDEAVAVFFEYL